MDDLIERKAAINAVDEAWQRWDVTTIDQLRDKLNELLLVIPSAQPEIIRCKDCKWKNKYNCTRAVEVFITDENYCAWADRREDE